MSADEPHADSSTPHRRQRWRERHAWSAIVLGAVMLATLALFGWATFWPIEPCSHPACARTRFALALEVDALQDIPPIRLDAQTREGPISLQSILAGGGIDVAITYDDLDVPYKAASGPLDRADLYQFVSAWRNRPTRADVDARLYALFTAGLISDKGEPLFGIMFDLAEREAFAVAPLTTQRFFETYEPDSIETLQLRTFVHELLHALNRDHIDAVTMADGRLTLEAPTRCIAQAERRNWRLVEPPLMALSPTTIRFFQTAASRDVLPGKENSPFAHRRTALAECESARANVIDAPPRNRWHAAIRRMKEVFSVRAANAQEDVDPMEVEERTEPPVEIALQAQPAAYPLGYPIAVRVSVRNTSDEPVPIKGRLNPGYGVIQIDHRRAGSEEWATLQPVTWFEPTSASGALLAPGERTEETIPIYFGEDGWTFPEAGEYEIRARVQLREPVDDVTSEPVAVRVSEPQTEADRAALQPLLDAAGELDADIGRLLIFGGRIGGAADITPLESVAALYGHTSLGGALRLTLLSHRLRPTIDPRTGERPLPELGEARVLVEDTCTDSGVAALTAELLEQRADSIPPDFAAGVPSAAAAWDGTTREPGASIPTYSEASLSAWGPSLHFCFNEAEPRAKVAAELRRVARRLASDPPERIVIVGHGDREGTCRHNDALALRRAERVRAALVEAGVNRRHIQTASLGERRPLDFAASQAAYDANRRVEILVEGGSSTSEPSEAPVMPSCPAR